MIRTMAIAITVIASAPAFAQSGSIQTTVPDGKTAFLTVTTSGSSNCFQASGNSWSSADIGKYFVARGLGISATEWTFTSKIASVPDSAHICTVDTPTLAKSGANVLSFWGTDQTANLQTAFTNGATSGRGAAVTGGIYLVSTPLSCMPPPLPWNNTTGSPPLCQFSPGAYLLYVGSNPANGAFVTFGSVAPDYSGYLREAVVQGGTIDCNFICGYAEFFPHFKHLKRSFQKTKNALWAGVRYNDSVNAPSASGGIVDFANDYEWDTIQLNITNISSAAQPVITTQQPHGLTGARFVSIVGANNVPSGIPLTFWAESLSPTTLLIHGINGSAWAPFAGSALLSLALPGYRKPVTFYTATPTIPPVVNTDGLYSTGGVGGHIQNNDLIDVYNVSSTGTGYDGTYTAKNLTGAGADGNWQLSLFDGANPVDGRSITVTGAGWLVKKYGLVPCSAGQCPLNAGVYMDGATDAEFQNNTINGTVVAFFANPTAGGYDGKYMGNHVWNYPQAGPMLYSHSIAGDNSLIGEQVDCPAWFGPKFTARNNTIMGSEMNCSGFNSNPDAMTTYLRLDKNASASIWGGRIKGQSSPTARPQFEVSDASVAGSPAQNAGHPNYKRFGLEADNTIYTVSDSYRWSLTGATSAAQPQGSTRYLGPTGAQPSAVNATYLAAYPGRAIKMTIQVDATPSAGQSFTFIANNGATTRPRLVAARCRPELIAVRRSFTAISASATISIFSRSSPRPVVQQMCAML